MYHIPRDRRPKRKYWELAKASSKYVGAGVAGAGAYGYKKYKRWTDEFDPEGSYQKAMRLAKAGWIPPMASPSGYAMNAAARAAARVPVGRRRFSSARFKKGRRTSRRSFRKMPYRRYKRRRFPMRRRRRRWPTRFNKRRRRYYRPIRTLSQRDLAVKVWKSEDAVGRTCDTGQTLFWIPYTNASAVDLNAAIVDTGQGAVRLGGSSAQQSDKYIFNYCKADSYLRNVSEHPIHCEVFFCVARQDTEDDTHSGVKTTALNYLMEGWQDRMLDADETAISLAVSNGAVTSNMGNLDPFHSTRFTEHFKIMKVKKRVLAPGHSMDVSVRKGPFRSTLFKLRQEKEDALGKITMFPLVKFTGSLGHDVLDEDSVTTMKLTLGCLFKKEINFTYVITHAPLIAVTDNKTSIANLEGPAEMAEVVDDA
jgi:hypothetical protein